jgi:hypothetical protein
LSCSSSTPPQPKHAREPSVGPARISLACRPSHVRSNCPQGWLGRLQPIGSAPLHIWPHNPTKTPSWGWGVNCGCGYSDSRWRAAARCDLTNAQSADATPGATGMLGPPQSTLCSHSIKGGQMELVIGPLFTSQAIESWPGYIAVRQSGLVERTASRNVLHVKPKRRMFNRRLLLVRFVDEARAYALRSCQSSDRQELLSSGT